ncbi:g9344 [Coccomyxa elongata]
MDLLYMCKEDENYTSAVAAMVRSHLMAAAAAALVLCLVIGRAGGQTTVQTTIGFFDVTPVTTYGQAPTYRISFPRPTSSPQAPTAGNAAFQNATNTPLIDFPLSAATFNPLCTGTSCANLYSFTGFSASGRLPAGVYSQVAAGYTGGTANGVTFTPVSSRTQGLPDVIFTVAPASTQFFYSFTAFTLANFTAAFNINTTNVNFTNVVPAGTAYEYITRNTPSPAVIGNFSMTITQVDQNSVALQLPSSFNAASLLSVVGTYTSVITFYPTSNFLAPVPLTVQFTVSSPAAPPPPPAGPPAPPAPNSGMSLPTTITLSVFFNQDGGVHRHLLTSCHQGVLVFTVAVKGPTPAQVPTDGTISIILQPSGFPVGTQAVVANTLLGSATAMLTVSAERVYGYGAQTAVATYSSSSTGQYQASQASVSFLIPECTNKWTEITKGVAGVIDTVKDIIVPEPYFTPGNGRYYGLGNNYEGYGYPVYNYPGQGAVPGQTPIEYGK